MQLVNDENGTTVAAASSIEADVRGVEGDKKAHSVRVGQLIAERAKAAGIDTVVFDRGGYTYGGRIAALADAARENGLKFLMTYDWKDRIMAEQPAGAGSAPARQPRRTR